MKAEFKWKKMADIDVTKKMEGNSSAMDIHKLPDCMDWLINIRVFRHD